MPDTLLILIPKDPTFIPQKENDQAAIQYITKLKLTNNHLDPISSSRTKGIQFSDCGRNFENVCCLYCGRTLSTDWWTEKMDHDYDSHGFRLNTFTLPCCKKETSLNHLKYNLNQGFSQYCLEIPNPKVDLTAPQINTLQKILKTVIEVIYCRI